MPATVFPRSIHSIYLFLFKILGVENNQTPYVQNAGSVYQPTASDMALSHVTQMRSLFHKKMKTLLLSISSLSGNNYNLENPENAIYERTRSSISPLFFESSLSDMQEYHEACLHEIENLAKHRKHAVLLRK